MEFEAVKEETLQELWGLPLQGENEKTTFNSLFIRKGEQRDPEGAIVLFRRHFNCFVCSFLISRILKSVDSFEERGFRVVIVGPDNWGIGAYRARYQIDPRVSIATDSSLKIYKTLDFVRQNNFLYTSLFDKQSMVQINKGIQEAQENGFSMAGFTTNIVWADYHQQGGILILKKKQNEEIRGEKEAEKWKGLVWRQGILQEDFPTLKQVQELCFGEGN